MGAEAGGDVPEPPPPLPPAVEALSGLEGERIDPGRTAGQRSGGVRCV